MRTFLKGAVVGIAASIGFCANVSFAGIAMNAVESGTVSYFVDDGAQCFSFKKGEAVKTVCARNGSSLGFYNAHVLQKWFWYIAPVIEAERSWLEVDFVSEVNKMFIRLSDEHAYYAAGNGGDFQEAMEDLKNKFLELRLKK